MNTHKVKLLEDYLLKRHSKAIVNRMLRMAEGWSSFDVFLHLPKSELLKRWRALSPDSSRDLGASFYKAFDDAALWWADPDNEPQKNELPDPILTQDQIKKTLEFMQLFDLREIKLSSIQNLISAVTTESSTEEKKEETI